MAVTLFYILIKVSHIISMINRLNGKHLFDFFIKYSFYDLHYRRERSNKDFEMNKKWKEIKIEANMSM